MMDPGESIEQDFVRPFAGMHLIFLIQLFNILILYGISGDSSEPVP